MDIKLEGYLVLQTAVYTDNVCWVCIVDWKASSESALRDLLISTIRLGKFGFIKIWKSTLSEAKISVLKNVGFQILKKKVGVAAPLPTILVRNTNEESPSDLWSLFGFGLLDLNNWDLRMLYSDSY